MHQTNEVPDWATVDPADRNIWQQMAADTQGLVTPGNAFSIAGFGLVITGLWLVADRSLWEGTLLVSFGRMADVIDGMVAERTGTKSPLGRLLDADFDKIGALLALLVFTLVHVLPVWVAVAIATQNVANIFISVRGLWRRAVINPSLPGKVSMAGYWIAIVGFVATRLLLHSRYAVFHAVTSTIAYGLVIISLTLGVAASAGYLKIVRYAPPHKHVKSRRNV